MIIKIIFIFLAGLRPGIKNIWSSLLICFGIFFFSTVTQASVKSVSIQGDFEAESNLFVGKALYLIENTGQKELYFHLPPNYFSQPDWRTSYTFFQGTDQQRVVERGELKILKSYIPKNINFPAFIQIKEVFLEGQKISFAVIDNELRPPLQSPKNTLLKIELPKIKDKEYFQVEIYFTTGFNKLPDGWKNILFDFAPREVVRLKGKPDFRDSYKIKLPYKLDVTLVKSSHNKTSSLFQSYDRANKPVLLMDDWDEQNSFFSFSSSEFYKKKFSYFQSRIFRILNFLYIQGWIKNNQQQYKFMVWDGSLTVSGQVILLPRSLFRYHFNFDKLMEIRLLQGLLATTILSHYNINAYKDPWLMPALESEVIRDYLAEVYQGDSSYFSWGDWMNPDYFQEYGLKPWLSQHQNYQTVGADSPLELTYFGNIYQPWWEKGFFLPRVLASGEESFKKQWYPKLKQLLNPETQNQTYLDGLKFIQFMTKKPALQKLAKKWLSKQGRIDYGIRNISFTKTGKMVDMQLDIINNGTLSPVFEVLIQYDKLPPTRLTLNKGAGNYSLQLPKRPQQVYLNPDYQLLEDDYLNNSWNLPLKIRPLWDFAGTDRWLFTIFPLISGNTFDKNLLGLQLDLSYLSQTSLLLEVWKRSKDNKMLLGGTFSHQGFPWKGTTLYFQSSQLGATDSYLLGIIQKYRDKNPYARVELQLSNNYLFTSVRANKTQYNQWQGIQLSGNLPVLEKAFSRWEVSSTLKQSYNKTLQAQSFTQETIGNSLKLFHDDITFLMNQSASYSQGDVPQQMLYPMGGPEAMSGFPRETDLLFPQRRLYGLGIKLPPFLTHSNLNLMQLMWLNRLESTVWFHLGEGVKKNSPKAEIFKDVELRFQLFGESLRYYDGYFEFSLAKPIDNAKYKDFRVIVFSNWVF